MKLEYTKNIFPDVNVYCYGHFDDNRGYFTETFNIKDINFDVQQANESFSHKGVFRGLHFQYDPKMAKLVRVIKGKIIDYFLDLRFGSPNQGQLGSYELQPKEWILIPHGFAHGFYAVEDSLIEYVCDGTYNNQGEFGIDVFSQGIDWNNAQKLPTTITRSQKDTDAKSYQDWLAKSEAQIFKL